MCFQLYLMAWQCLCRACCPFTAKEGLMGSSVVYSGEQHNIAANSDSMSIAALLSASCTCCDHVPHIGLLS